MSDKVSMAFERESVFVEFSDLLPVKQLQKSVKTTIKKAKRKIKERKREELQANVARDHGGNRMGASRGARDVAAVFLPLVAEWREDGIDIPAPITARMI